MALFRRQAGKPAVENAETVTHRNSEMPKYRNDGKPVVGGFFPRIRNAFSRAKNAPGNFEKLSPQKKLGIIGKANLAIGAALMTPAIRAVVERQESGVLLNREHPDLFPNGLYTSYSFGGPGTPVGDAFRNPGITAQQAASNDFVNHSVAHFAIAAGVTAAAPYASSKLSAYLDKVAYSGKYKPWASNLAKRVNTTQYGWTKRIIYGTWGAMIAKEASDVLNFARATEVRALPGYSSVPAWHAASASDLALGALGIATGIGAYKLGTHLTKVVKARNARVGEALEQRGVLNPTTRQKLAQFFRSNPKTRRG